jgi:hypothetical protein
MDGYGVQRYSDKFLQLASKLKWNLNSESTTYQFKLGLEPWLAKLVAISESNLAESSREQLSLDKLISIALRYESNKYILNTDHTKYKHKHTLCYHCGKPGHKIAECKKKLHENKFLSVNKNEKKKRECYISKVRDENR